IEYCNKIDSDHHLSFHKKIERDTNEERLDFSSHSKRVLAAKPSKSCPPYVKTNPFLRYHTSKKE
ncbi:MAG: hypothetical protein MUP09_10565, partial [Thiovulaceae bacterium]|nr:hypothetical protein [Sulfurimonadaceae bacterium]